MARSRLVDTTDDLITDSGAVLWSFVKGEQLEFPITLDFLKDATSGYIFEAVILEALNKPGVLDRPVSIKPSGAQTTLSVRTPNFVGNWNTATAYSKNQIVKYADTYYFLLNGTSRVNSTVPSLDSTWVETALNIIYIQFLSNLGSTWEIEPTVEQAVYGFFELRVTEPVSSSFRSTWKPIRGMVELLFSPTDLVIDV
jgi:hypothetical protein